MLHSSARGKVLRKSVYRYTVVCPECDEAAIYDDGAKPICPECGIVCTGRDEGQRMLIDAKSAGRVSGD